MKYIMITAGELGLYGYQKNSYRRRQRYVTAKLQHYREKFLPQYERTPAIRKMAASYFVSRAEARLLNVQTRRTSGKDCYLSLRTGTQAFGGKKAKGDVDGWEKFFFQPIKIYSNNCKEVCVKKPQKMRFKLVELKTDGSHYEFLIRETIMNKIVEWEDLPNVGTVREYLRKHPFPKDNCYWKEDFLDEIEKAGGHIHLFVEKRDTAEFICKLCYELIRKIL
jgi:hypothetical protein